MRTARGFCVGGALLLLTGCVTGSYSHASTDEPITMAVLRTLRPEADTLGECLARLGAPNRVFEYDSTPDGGAGAALLWYWRDAAGWGINVSSGSDEVPGSFEFDMDGAELPGCVLWFDRDLVLQRWRVGQIGELLPGRVRPSQAADG